MAASVLLALCPVASLACEAETMQMTDRGFILKVVGGSDKIEAKTAPGSEDVAFVLDLLQPYFVICEDGDTYRISDIQAQTVAEAEAGKVGYVLKDQIYEWATREALNFTPVIKGPDRPEIVAWDSEATFEKFLETGDQNIGKPAFRENRESTLKREGSVRPYPVLSGKTRQLLTKDKRTFNVLLPAALPPEAKIVITDAADGDVKQAVETALTGGTFVIAFDSTASMGPFARDVADDIRTAFEALPADVQAGSKIGFVFYRDEGDEEKVVIVEPLEVKAATDALKEASELVSGGGDAAEPVLDAAYIAGHLFPWDKSGQISGRRIIIAVLSDDAKPYTTGRIYDGVSEGLSASDVAGQLINEGIEVITVQAGPEAGENLASVLSTLALETNGTFIEWGGGDRRDKVTSAVGAQLAAERVATFEEGETILETMFDYNGFPAIPLEVLDGEKLDSLRKAGIEFNIDPGVGAVLVQEGYMLENPDLLEPQIQIEKSTLQALIRLFSALGIAGVDVEGMKQSAGEALAAIAGEDYDPTEPISETIAKQTGIQFRTDLLAFDLEFLASMNPTERAGMAKRVQEAGDKLSEYLEANLEDFDETPAVWMPVDKLP